VKVKWEDVMGHHIVLPVRPAIIANTVIVAGLVEYVLAVDHEQEPALRKKTTIIPQKPQGHLLLQEENQELIG